MEVLAGEADDATESDGKNHTPEPQVSSKDRAS